VVLTDLGDGRTEQHGSLSPEQYGCARDGWSSFFDRMAGHLAGA
jgi:hypothetical protein